MEIRMTRPRSSPDPLWTPTVDLVRHADVGRHLTDRAFVSDAPSALIGLEPKKVESFAGRRGLLVISPPGPPE